MRKRYLIKLLVHGNEVPIIVRARNRLHILRRVKREISSILRIDKSTANYYKRQGTPELRRP